MFTHPYVEDIQVEPKSLYGFMLPLFTEFLVDKKLLVNTMGATSLTILNPIRQKKARTKNYQSFRNLL